MKQALLFLISFCFAFCFQPAMGQSQHSFHPDSAQYLWPTEASPYLTSTFGETRSQHFHAALDIKTWGRRGYEVYATRDGILDRIAIGPKGYGKVIYLKHNDGSYSVYAHLLSFNDRLQSMVDSARLAEDYKFEIEKFWGWKNIKIEQGQVIGYSGASGIGPPHLHFELRTPSHKPFNPLLTNLDVTDTIAPQFQAIAIEPLSAQSTIESENRIYTTQARASDNGYELGTVTTSGPVGLAAHVFDQSNRVNNAYAVYELSLSVDGQPLFTSRVDSFSYRETDQMFLDRVYPLLQHGRGGYQRLYLVDGNTLPFYTTSPNRGVLNLPPGNHEVTITATDYFGNSSTASLNLQVKDPKSHQQNDKSPGTYSPNTPIPSVHYWDWFANWFTIPESTFNQITVAADSNQLTAHENGIAVDLKTHNYLFLNNQETGPIQLYRTNPNTESILPSADQHGFVLFPKSTFYDTLSVGMTVNKHRTDSITVDVIPEAYPLREAYNIYIRRNSALTDTSNISFYKFDRFDDDEEWELIPTRFSKSFIIGEAESLGTFTTLRDTIAPTLQNPRIRRRPDQQWVLMIDAIDNLSGIDYERTIILVNDVRGIAEFEPEDDRLVYYRPDFVPTDSMSIDLTAYDKQGNRISRSFDLQR